MALIVSHMNPFHMKNLVSLTLFSFQYFLHNTPGLPTGPFRLETTSSAHISLPSHPCYMTSPVPCSLLQKPNNPVASANHKSSHYRIFPNLPALPPFLAQYSQTPSASFLPLPWETRLHTHTKQHAQLYCCILQYLGLWIAQKHSDNMHGLKFFISFPWA